MAPWRHWWKIFWIYPHVIISRPPYNNLRPPVIISRPPVINWRLPHNNWWPRVINWRPPHNNWWSPVIIWWSLVINWRPPHNNWWPRVINQWPLYNNWWFCLWFVFLTGDMLFLESTRMTTQLKKQVYIYHRQFKNTCHQASVISYCFQAGSWYDHQEKSVLLTTRIGYIISSIRLYIYHR